jgi:hypothetical protein
MCNIVHKWADRLVPKRLDTCLQSAVVSKNEHLNMKLPEDGSGARRNVSKNVIDLLCTVGSLNIDMTKTIKMNLMPGGGM